MSLVGAMGTLTTSEVQAVLTSLSAEWLKGFLRLLRNIMIFIGEKYINMLFFYNSHRKNEEDLV